MKDPVTELTEICDVLERSIKLGQFPPVLGRYTDRLKSVIEALRACQAKPRPMEH